MTQRISHYELIERLGEGGMGVVYKALDTNLQRYVALKVLPAAVQSDPAKMERLVEEARIAAGLNHPNICTIYELGSVAAENSPPFIAMEYLEGRTLRDTLAGGRLPVNEVASIAEQIAAGLQEAHGKGVVHRDIKPENIVLTPGGTVKILDFGLAHASTQQPVEKGKISGSGLYMSPEQYRDEDLDPRTDTWSFGVVLYEMLAGQPPFHGRYAQSVLYAVLNEEPAPVQETRPDIPPDLASLCHRCLRKLREDRPERMDDVIGELRAINAPKEPPAAGGHHWRILRWVVPAAVVVLAFMMWLLDRGSDRKSTVDPDHIRLAILPIENLSGSDSIAKWSPLCQTMLERNLSGHTSFVVSESFSINSMYAGRNASKSDFYEQVQQMNIDYLIRCGIGIIGSTVQIDIQVVKVGSRTVEYSKARRLASKESLGSVIDSFSLDIANHFRVGAQASGQSQDLRPWLSGKNRNLEAEEAFDNAYRLIYEGVPNVPRKYLRKALQMDSGFIAPRIWLAAGLWQSGDTAEARIHERALHRMYADATVFEKAMIDFVSAFIQDNVQKEKAALEKALSVSPGNNIVLMNLSGVLFDMEKYAEAERMLAITLRNNWHFYAAYRLTALCQMRLNRHAEAFRTMERAFELNPSNPQAAQELSCIARRTGQLEQAVAYEERAISLLKDTQKSDADIYVWIAKVLCEYDLHPIAFLRYEKAMKLAPRHVDAFVGFAEAKRALGYSADALISFRAALRLAPDRHDLYKSIGDIYAELGSLDSARIYYQGYLKRDPASRTATAVRDKLQSFDAPSTH
jgi:eukaryotic-like serine/threonine-protein kinase